MLLTLLIEIAVVVVALSAIGAVTIVGRERLVELYVEFGLRLRESGVYLVALAVLLAFNSMLRELTEDFSVLLVGWDITAGIEAIEGNFVVFVQSFQTELLTTYFSYIYIHGYVFLLVFPLFAYLALRDRIVFRELVVAYGLNYLLGTVLYVMFIAMGPRNSFLVDGLLYTTFPQFQFLTSQVNNPTNVFPSLHTSLAATAAIFAYKTRGPYPRWLPIATVLAVSVIISTMYLGIHWATDVVAGLILAGACVVGAERYIARHDQWAAATAEGKSTLLAVPYVGTGVEKVSTAVGVSRWTTRFEAEEKRVSDEEPTDASNDRPADASDD